MVELKKINRFVNMADGRFAFYEVLVEELPLCAILKLRWGRIGEWVKEKTEYHSHHSAVRRISGIRKKRLSRHYSEVLD